MNETIRMQVSAFVDGELPDNESELLLRRLCQDAELRQVVAEYYAIGRVMRTEAAVPGLANLRDRIGAALDENAAQAVIEAIEPVRRNYLRPVGGIAIAATVAAVALLGLQQFGSAPIGDDAPAAVAGDTQPAPSYTVPRVYHEMHREGASNIDARLATLRMLEEEIGELDEDDGPDETAADEAGGTPAPGTP